MKRLIQKLRKAFAIFFVSIRAFFDRNYNLLFNSRNCIKIDFYEDRFNYNDMIFDGKENFRCLGKRWYVLHEY